MTRGLLLSLGLLALATALVGATALADAVVRPTSPETVVRQYFAALEAEDVETALGQIEPEARGRVAGFVESVAGNEYRIRGIAVEQASVLSRLRGEPGSPHHVTLFLDITEPNGAEWQASPRIPLVNAAGRWYIGLPPLMP